MRRINHGFLIGFFVLGLSACAAMDTGGGGSGNGGPGEMEIRTGVVEQVTDTQVKTNHDTGVGAILGGLGGVALGSLIGRGTGRDVAMIAGALAGGVGGNYAEQRQYDKPQEAQQIIVRMKNGVLVSVTQPVNAELKPGSKVYIEGQGAGARVVPQND
ncbi:MULTISPECIES: glycine zipper 2TM domain-containing protein [Pseudomonas]|uniref:glycine zipper 2TM domain-containing protein n=1 Tax=Pseudomonas nitroreducens TaxID=46680 RepID=UPI001E356E82|nr:MULTISPECIES: glycine zipper 2TM domain-containing protein [Pseudomonas]MCE4072228.1 glycine zipper 2TM domain-containing protein [Pseudomonas nitritireducens]MCE4081906.1 glycine zipper 2TM domain-containing protein [Pseudomonas nitroreducens]